jgi:hypothetical protein
MICLLIILLVLFPSCKWTELESAERSLTPNRDEEHIEQEHERILQELLKPPVPVSHVSTPSSAISPDMKGLTWSGTPPNSPVVLGPLMESLSLNPSAALTEQNVNDLKLRSEHTPPIFKPESFNPTQVSPDRFKHHHHLSGGTILVQAPDSPFSPLSDISRRSSDISASSDISYVDITKRHMSHPSLDRLGYAILSEERGGVEYFFGCKVYTVHYGDNTYSALAFATLMNMKRPFIEWLVMTEREFRNRQMFVEEDETKAKAADVFKAAEIESEAALNAEIKAAVAKIEKKEDVYQ